MSLDLLKRSELARGLTNAEQDGNLTAIETFINAILAGTAGYDAGNALKVGGVAAASLWTDTNNTKSIAASGWQKLASGLIIQWGIATTGTELPASGIYYSSANITLPMAFPTGGLFIVGGYNGATMAWPMGSYFSSASAVSMYLVSTASGHVGSKTISYFTIGH